MEKISEIFSMIVFYSPLILLIIIVALLFNTLYKHVKRKTREAAIRKVKIGDTVETVKGLQGTVVKIDEDSLDLEFDGHCATFARQAIVKQI